MSRVQMERHLAGQKLSGKVAFVATLLFPILGVACLLLSEQVAAHLPHILGAVMLFVGAADIFTDLLDKGSVPDKITVGTDVVMIVLGVVTLLNTTESGPTRPREGGARDRRVARGARIERGMARAAGDGRLRARTRHDAAHRPHREPRPSRAPARPGAHRVPVSRARRELSRIGPAGLSVCIPQSASDEAICRVSVMFSHNVHVAGTIGGYRIIPIAGHACAARALPLGKEPRR